MLNKYSVIWSKSINEIAASDWERIYGKSTIKSQEFFLSMEKSNFQQLNFYYLQILQNKLIIAIVPCFCYKIDILNLTTSSIAQFVIKNIRKINASFLKVKSFVIGTYAASCEHFIGYDPLLSMKSKIIVYKLIEQQLKQKSIETKSKILFIKDIREHDIVLVKRILSHNFYYFSSFPTNIVPILAECKYPNALRSKYRKRFYDYQKESVEHFNWEISTNFSNQIELFEKLYKNVLNKAKNKFELLNAAFFENINNLLASQSFLLIAKDKTGDAQLMILVLEDTECLIPLYMGIKYKTDDTRALYNTALANIIKEAEYRNKKYVDLGQTSYYPKVMSGAIVENVYYGFWSKHYFLCWIIKNLFPQIFIPHRIPKSVYLNSYKQNAYEVLEKQGFILLNK